jgi:hypothetical protein
MASKKSGRETPVRDVTGVPGSAGGAPKAGVVKKIVKGGGRTDPNLSGGKPESKSK